MDVINLKIEFRRGKNKEEKSLKGQYYPEHYNKNKYHSIYVNVNRITGLKDVFCTMMHELIHFCISITKWRREVDSKKEHRLVYSAAEFITNLTPFIFK